MVSRTSRLSVTHPGSVGLLLKGTLGLTSGILGRHFWSLGQPLNWGHFIGGASVVSGVLEAKVSLCLETRVYRLKNLLWNSCLNSLTVFFIA